MEEDTNNLQAEQKSIEPKVDVKVITSMLDEETLNEINNSKDLTMVVEENVKEISFWDQKKTEKNELVVGLNNKVIVPSRYLTGSIGSCHDLCKRGYRNEVDIDTRSNVVRTPLVRAPMSRTLSEEKVLPKVAVSAESSKKKSMVWRLSFPVAKAENGKRSLAKEIKYSGKWNGEPKTRVVGSPRKGSNEIKTVKKPGNFHLKLVQSPNQKATEMRIVKGEQKPAGRVSASCPSKPGMKKAVNMNWKNHNYLEGSSHVKCQISLQQEARAKQPQEVLEKTLYMIEPADRKGKHVETSEKAKKRLSTTQGNGISESRFTKSMLPTLHKPFKYRGRELQMTEFSRSKRSYVTSGESKSNPSTTRAKLSTQKSIPGSPKSKQSIEAKAQVKRAELGQSGDKGSSIWRLNFKKRTVTTLSGGDSSPKKLKFRRPKRISEDQNVEVNYRKAKYKNEAVVREEPYENGAESEKVVLKHQETMGKKDGVDLNNVIEETASKLVKSSQSKVKALVGAFETLISLGDRMSLMAASAS